MLADLPANVDSADLLMRILLRRLRPRSGDKEEVGPAHHSL
jgi:hypothetical protein